MKECHAIFALNGEYFNLNIGLIFFHTEDKVRYIFERKTMVLTRTFKTVQKKLQMQKHKKLQIGVFNVRISTFRFGDRIGFWLLNWFPFFKLSNDVNFIENGRLSVENKRIHVFDVNFPNSENPNSKLWTFCKSHKEALAKSSPGFQKLYQSALESFRSSCRAFPRFQKLLQRASATSEALESRTAYKA